LLVGGLEYLFWLLGINPQVGQAAEKYSVPQLGHLLGSIPALTPQCGQKLPSSNKVPQLLHLCSKSLPPQDEHTCAESGLFIPQYLHTFIVLKTPYSGKELFPLVAESHNLTLFVYKPCSVVFVLF